MRAPIAILVPLLLIAGCSGTSGTTLGDGGPETSTGDGGCINPVEGAPCTSNEVACQPPGNVCCVGYAWMCQNGAWIKAGVGCACNVGQPFACGSSVSCNSGTQYCVDQAPGIASADGGVLPDSFSCSTLPTDCTSFPTCACVEAHNPCPTTVASCTENNGEVTVHCMGQ